VSSRDQLILCGAGCRLERGWWVLWCILDGNQCSYLRFASFRVLVSRMVLRISVLAEW
jgi:hypothetical protein